MWESEEEIIEFLGELSEKYKPMDYCNFTHEKVMEYGYKYIEVDCAINSSDFNTFLIFLRKGDRTMIICDAYDMRDALKYVHKHNGKNKEAFKDYVGGEFEFFHCFDDEVIFRCPVV